MLVDDEPDIRVILAQILQPKYEAVTASNGLEALERLDRFEPDFIVMDVMMPVLDGFDTTRAIKKDMRFTNVPVLFLTARKDNQSVRDALRAGGELYLEKPFSPPELIVRIDEVITRHKLTPRPKRFTVEEAEAFFAAASLPPAAAGAFAGAQTSAPNRTPEGSRPGQQNRVEAIQEPRARVLIVDDDPDILGFARSVLEQDFEIITTVDSESSLDKIVAYQPDLLLLDINMPRLNGFHLAHLIRLNRRLRGAKVIFISSQSDRDSVERAFNLGASEFVEKPFTPEQLTRKVMEVTRRGDFQRGKKRIDFREILRRENTSTRG